MRSRTAAAYGFSGAAKTTENGIHRGGVMSFISTCPFCGQKYKVDETSRNQPFVCSNCGKSFVLQADATPPAPSANVNKSRKKSGPYGWGCLLLAVVVIIPAVVVMNNIIPKGWNRVVFLLGPIGAGISAFFSKRSKSDTGGK